MGNSQWSLEISWWGETPGADKWENNSTACTLIWDEKQAEHCHEDDNGSLIHTNARELRVD